nr:MAG TPA: hypothetical protein [Caudoviricetes sp.]
MQKYGVIPTPANRIFIMITLCYHDDCVFFSS